MSVGSLRAILRLDNDQFNKGVDQSERRFGRAKKAIALGAKAMVGALVGVGGAMLGAAMKTAQYGDEVAKSARKAGLGVEQFQELRFAFKQGGVEAATFDTAMQKFNKRLGESATSGGTADEAFERLGISLHNADGQVRSASGAMDEALPKLAAIESDAERAAVAGDLFGQRAGPELAAALSEGMGGIDEARQKAQDLGIVMSEDATKAAEQFGDQWDDLKQQMRGFVRSAGTPVMKWMSESLFPALEEDVIPAAKSTAETIGGLIDAFNDLPGPVKAATGGMAAFVAALGPILWTGGMVVSQVGRMTAGFRAARGAATKLNTSLKTMRGTLLGGLGIGVAVAAVWDLKRAWEAAGEEAEASVQRIIEQSTSAEQAVRGIDSEVQAHRDELGSMGRAWSNVGNALTGPIGAFHNARNAISDTARQLGLMRGRSQAANAEFERTGMVIPGAREAVRRLAEGTHGLLGPLQQQIDKQRAAGDQTDRLEREMGEASEAASGFAEKLDQLSGSTIGVERATIRWREQVTTLTGKISENGTTLDRSTDAGRRNRTAILDAVEAAQSHAQAMVEDGASTDEATAKLRGHIDELKNQLRQAGFTEAQVDDYIGSLNAIPPKKETTVEAHTGQAESDLRTIHDLLNNLPKQKRTVVELATGTFGVPTGDGPGASGGGPAAARAAQAAAGLPLRKTSGYRTVAENLAAGGVPDSYHRDPDNPATDWAGPRSAMRRMVDRLQRMGGWREVLHPWNDPAHGDHVHVAHSGGYVTNGAVQPLGSDVIARLADGETVVPAGKMPAGNDGGDQARLLRDIHRELRSGQKIMVDREVLGEVVRDEFHRLDRDNITAGVPQ